MRRMVAVSMVATCSVAACALDWTVPQGADTTTHADAAADAPFASETAPPTVGTSPPKIGPEDPTLPGQPSACGSTAASCPSDAICTFSGFSCGASGSTATCLPRATLQSDCPIDSQQQPNGSYCGCDRKWYASACAVLLAGVDLANASTCPGGSNETEPRAIAGYASCPELVVEDLSRPRAAMYRCVSAQEIGCTLSDAGLCGCATAKLCANGGDQTSCEGNIVHCR